MQQFEQIPMEPGLRDEVRQKYAGPLRRNLCLFSLFLGGIILLLTWNAITQQNLKILIAILPFLAFGLMLYPKIYRHKRHYHEDYLFGFVIRENVAVTKVFDTPSGINIYWLSSDAIKTFVPDPYRRFREGDLLFIYYLKFSKEYLAYEC